MTTVVLDASALIAMLKQEPGGDGVAKIIGDSKITAINFAEVISHFCYAGMPTTEVDAMLRPLPLVVVSADEKLATLAGHLSTLTLSRGLSLGDRFCLALAQLEKLPAWTSDRNWQTLAEAVQVEITLIR